jgi:hypothetical protein
VRPEPVADGVELRRGGRQADAADREQQDQPGEPGGAGAPVQRAQGARALRRRGRVPARAEHGHRHAEREPQERARDGVRPRVRRRVAEGQRAQRQRGHAEQGQRGELRADLEAHGPAVQELRGRERVEREQDVELHLDAQAPRGGDAAPEVLQRRVLQEEVVDVPVAEDVAAEAGPDRQHGERQPVRRDDAQHAAARVAQHARRGAALEARSDERAIEQEARDHEEQRDADVEA